MAQKQTVLAIDGPSGSGKSSVAQKVSEQLDATYVDTGAIYRALGLYCHDHGIDIQNEQAVMDYFPQINLEYGKSKDKLVVINGEDLTLGIREHRVSEMASKISKLQKVREYLLSFQRELAQSRVCVFEGRDIGTVIFPQAFLKIFLTADVDERARRRQQQLAQKNGGEEIDLNQLIKDLKDRDERDSTREVAPLKPSEDSVILDSTHLSEDEVVAKIVNLAKERATDIGLTL